MVGGRQRRQRSSGSSAVSTILLVSQVRLVEHVVVESYAKGQTSRRDRFPTTRTSSEDGSIGYSRHHSDIAAKERCPANGMLRRPFLRLPRLAKRKTSLMSLREMARGRSLKEIRRTSRRRLLRRGARTTAQAAMRMIRRMNLAALSTHQGVPVRGTRMTRAARRAKHKLRRWSLSLLPLLRRPMGR